MTLVEQSCGVIQAINSEVQELGSPKYRPHTTALGAGSWDSLDIATHSLLILL